MKARFIFSGSIDLEFEQGTPAERQIQIARDRLAKGELVFELDVDDVLTICRVCGCTDDEPCFGGCAWVDGEPDLCSACVQQDTHNRVNAELAAKLAPSDSGPSDGAGAPITQEDAGRPAAGHPAGSDA